MKRLFLISVLFCAAHSFGAIAYVGNGSGSCFQNDATNHTCAITVTGSSNSHAQIVACALHVTSARITSVVDSGGSIYSQQVGQNQSTNVRLEAWTTGITGSVASTTITVTVDSDTDFSCVTVEDGGSLAYGTIFPQSQATGSTSTATVSSSLDNNNWNVGTFAVTGANTITANVGNLRQSASSANTSVAIADNTAASAGSSIIARISLSPNATSAHASFELRTVAPAGGVRHRVTQDN